MNSSQPAAEPVILALYTLAHPLLLPSGLNTVQCLLEKKITVEISVLSLQYFFADLLYYKIFLLNLIWLSLKVR